MGLGMMPSASPVTNGWFRPDRVRIYRRFIGFRGVSNDVPRRFGHAAAYPVSAALILLAGYHLWRDSSAVGWRRWTFCGLGVGALLVRVSSLLWMIGFHVGDYYVTYHYHVTNLVSIGTLK